MELPAGLATAIKVTPEMTSTLLNPYLEAISLLVGDGVSEDLVEACMARCLVDHKDPVAFAFHFVNLRAKARGEKIQIAEPGWAMPERGGAHGQLALGRRGGRRATDPGEGADAR